MDALGAFLPILKSDEFVATDTIVLRSQILGVCIGPANWHDVESDSVSVPTALLDRGELLQCPIEGCGQSVKNLGSHKPLVQKQRNKPHHRTPVQQFCM